MNCRKKIFFLSNLLLLFSGNIFSQLAGKGTIQEKTIGEFNLSVYLPPGYDTSKMYPTLYINDGQTAFGSTGLDMDAMADDLIDKKLIRPLIIVGIYSDAERTSNYVPYEDKYVREDFGAYSPDAANYSLKIINQIIPFIEKNYKVSQERGIGGYSFGGLHATWMALHHADKFSFSAGLSPSYWVDDFQIFKDAPKALPTQTYYFDVGTGEWNYYVPMLLHSKLPMLQRIFYYEDYGGYHRISDWKGQKIKNTLLLFTGHTDSTKYTWDIKQEIIKSSSTGKFYLRINPIIRYSNGLTCSISYAANFILINGADGVVNDDGSFRFINPVDLNVKINYRGDEKSMTIKYAEVEKIKNTL